MFGEKAFELLKELQRSPDTIPLFDDDGVRQILEEIKAIFDENCEQAANYSASRDRSLWPLLNFRHAALQRNKRCLLAYFYERLQKVKELRWEFGTVLPADIKNALCEPEVSFFYAYSQTLASYMRSIGEGQGIDLTSDLRPPKTLYVEVKCMEDYGKFELENGLVIHLNKPNLYCLPRNEVEPLIRQGILKHIS